MTSLRHMDADLGRYNNLECACEEAGISLEPIKGTPPPPRTVQKSNKILCPPPPCALPHCSECAQQWRYFENGVDFLHVYRYIYVDDAAASKVLVQLVQKIDDDFAWLKSKMQSHADQIYTQWVRGPDARRRIIQSSTPEMYPTSFPELNLFWNKAEWLSARRDHANTLLARS